MQPIHGPDPSPRRRRPWPRRGIDGLNPVEPLVRLPEVVPGFPDRLVPKNEAAAAALRGRTLTALYNQRGKPEGAWLDALHRGLDAAAAYGWPADLANDEVLTRLLALNHARE